MEKIKWLTIVLIALCFGGYSQSSKEDSLISVLKNAKEDSSVYNANIALLLFYQRTDNEKKLLGVGNDIIKLGDRSKRDDWKGVGYRVLGDYYRSVDQGSTSLQNYLIAIKYLEKTTNHLSLITAYTNIGYLYYTTSKLNEAAFYFKKGLSTAEKFNVTDVETKTSLYNNLGVCAAEEKNYLLAKLYFKNSLATWMKAKDSLSMAYAYNNLALIATQAKELDTVYKYYTLALNLKLKFCSHGEIIDAYNSMAAYFILKKEPKKAIEYLLEAEKYVDTSNYDNYSKNLYWAKAEVYEDLKDYKNAYKAQKKHSQLVLNQNIKSELSDFDRAGKAISDSIINSSQKQIQELTILTQNAQIDRDEQQKIFLIIGLALVLSGGILFYNRYKITKKQKEIIEKQKDIVEQQHGEISLQKELIEEKQKEIIDSITYANRIQNAVLTNDSVWQKISPQHFVLFKPKDIVSGDFYWAYETPNNKSIWAAADCTGHGVPGAFMSMLGNSLLNEIVIENKTHKASEILDRLRTKIIWALSKENVSENDGMDIGLCVWDKSNNTLEFAGANNNAVIVRNNALQEIKGDKMPVGNYHGEEKPFTSNEFKLQKNDAIYLYTDGYADQFGGPKGKKFRYKQLDELLITNHAQDMSLQAKLLEETFLTWKGALVQTDDICIIGIKVLT